MLLTMHVTPQSQQTRVAQWPSLSSCSSQHHNVIKGKTHQVQSISLGTLQHPNATSQQHDMIEVHKDVQDLRVIQEKVLRDQDHSSKVIKKQDRAHQHYLNIIKEQKLQEEKHDLHKQEEYQEEQHGSKAAQEQVYCEQKHDLNTVQEQEQVLEQEHGIQKTQRGQLSQDQQNSLGTLQKLKKPQEQGKVQLEKAEQQQQHFDLKEQDDMRNEKLYQQMLDEKQEDLKLVQTQKQMYQVPQLVLGEAREQELQQEHQQKLRKIQLQPEPPQEQDQCFVLLPIQHEKQEKQDMHMLQVQVPGRDVIAVSNQQQHKPVKALITKKPIKSFVYQQRCPKGYVYFPPISMATKAVNKRKICKEVREDGWKAARSFVSQEVYLPRHNMYPIFAQVKDGHLQNMNDCHLDKKKFKGSDDHHIKCEGQKGFRDNLLIAKHFDGLEPRDVIEASKELDFCSGKYSEFRVMGRSDKKHLLLKRGQTPRTGVFYQRTLIAGKTKQEVLDELNAKSEDLKKLKTKRETQAQLQDLKFKKLKGPKDWQFNPQSSEILTAGPSDSQTIKELKSQKSLHSKFSEIEASDQLCKDSDKELEVPFADGIEQCTSWSKALVKCLKEIQARTSRHHILQEFGHSGSCMVANCRPSCRLFRRLRHHVVTVQHKCSLFHLYSTLLQEHVSVCCSPTCGLHACPAIRANRRIKAAAASDTNVVSCVPKTHVEMSNKITASAAQ